MEDQEKRKLYKKPDIIHEMDLETRAGSGPSPESVVEDPFDV